MTHRSNANDTNTNTAAHTTAHKTTLDADINSTGSDIVNLGHPLGLTNVNLGAGLLVDIDEDRDSTHDNAEPPELHTVLMYEIFLALFQIADEDGTNSVLAQY